MENLKKRIGDIVVLAREQLWPTLQNGDTASETHECLREFQANVAAAQHDHMARQAVEFERLDVRERMRGAKAGDVGDGRMGAQIQEHAVAIKRAYAAVLQ